MKGQPIWQFSSKLDYMNIVIQRVSRASVDVIDSQGRPSEDFQPKSVGQGLLLLVGINDHDGPDQVNYASRKIVNMRLFEDGQGKMNLSLLEIRGQIMSIPQFTLLADIRHGNRPSFTAAGKPIHAKQVWEDLNESLSNYGVEVSKGSFGSHMRLDFINDGPVTILLDTDQVMP